MSDQCLTSFLPCDSISQEDLSLRRIADMTAIDYSQSASNTCGNSNIRERTRDCQPDERNLDPDRRVNIIILTQPVVVRPSFIRARPSPQALVF